MFTGIVTDLGEVRSVKPQGGNLHRHAHTLAIGLDVEQTRQLLQQAPAAYHTQVNDLLLAALSRAIWSWSGREDITIELEGHGREDIFVGADLTLVCRAPALLADRSLALAVERAEADVRLLRLRRRRESQANRDVDQAERDGSVPDRAHGAAPGEF